MAVVKTDVVEVFAASNKLIRTIDLDKRRMTYFKWLPDRDLALMALQQDLRDGTTATLTRIDPLREGNESSATIPNLPRGSTMTDVAFSTATNVIYMQVHVASNPDLYRVYRTDANHDLQRTYLTTTRIGRIATLFDIDYLVYDDLTDGTVIARHTDGSWGVISPTVGKYRLIGTEGNNVYIARLDNNSMAIAIYKGGIKSSAKPDFVEVKKLASPVDARQLTVGEAAKQTK